MPKVKKSIYRLGSPKTPNPDKEMSWCFSKHIYVSCRPEAIKDGRYWKQGKFYAVTIKQGDKYRESEYKYTQDNIVDAIHDTYRLIYQNNYGKEK